MTWATFVGECVVGKRFDNSASEFVDCSVLAGEPQRNDVQWPIDSQLGLHRSLPSIATAGKRRESNAL